MPRIRDQRLHALRLEIEPLDCERHRGPVRLEVLGRGRYEDSHRPILPLPAIPFRRPCLELRCGPPFDPEPLPEKLECVRFVTLRPKRRRRRSHCNGPAANRPEVGGLVREDALERGGKAQDERRVQRRRDRVAALVETLEEPSPSRLLRFLSGARIEEHEPPPHRLVQVAQNRRGQTSERVCIRGRIRIDSQRSRPPQRGRRQPFADELEHGSCRGARITDDQVQFEAVAEEQGLNEAAERRVRTQRLLRRNTGGIRHASRAIA